MFTHIFLGGLILEMLVMGFVSTNCPNLHLQTEYCNNDIVFLAQRPRTVSGNGSIKMIIESIFKGKLLLDDIADQDAVDVETNLDLKELTEGIFADRFFVVFAKLKNGKVYAGGCTPFYPFKWMRPYQEWVKSALTNKFQLGCNCIGEIGPNFADLTCEYLSSFMMKKNGKCTWIKTESYVICQDFFKWIGSNKH